MPFKVLPIYFIVSKVNPMSLAPKTTPSFMHLSSPPSLVFTSSLHFFCMYLMLSRFPYLSSDLYRFLFKFLKIKEFLMSFQRRNKCEDDFGALCSNSNSIPMLMLMLIKGSFQASGQSAVSKGEIIWQATPCSFMVKSNATLWGSTFRSFCIVMMPEDTVSTFFL